jgi:hypothetical protein
MNLLQTALARCLPAACLWLACPADAAQPASGQGAFTTVNNPGGGQYVYGNLTGRGTAPDALVYMLKMVHSHFGDRPQVGKFFQSRGNGSLATFFSVNAKTQGNTPLSGLLIVSVAKDGTGSVAVLYDQKSRFASTEPAMMRSLSAVWRPAGGSAPQPGSHPAPQQQQVQGGPTQLFRATGGDGSAVIGLPAGWHLTGVSGGQLTAVGSNGEMLGLGLIYQNLPFYVRGDLFEVYVNALNMIRQRKGMSTGTFNVVSRMNLPGQAIQVIYEVDFHDNIGPRKGSVRVGVLGPRAISVSNSNIPARLATQENATLMAVIHSYRQVDSVIASEGRADLARVQRDAARANAQAQAINQRREAGVAAFDQHMNNIDRSNGAFDQHMDDIDRASKMTQDYILDRSVVRDNELSERGTVSDSYADSLVRSNPDRFQIVPNQGLIKGRDY